MTQNPLFFPSRQAIRKTVRQRRQNITDDDRNRYAQQAAARALAWPALAQAQYIAAFISFDGELNTQVLIDALWRNGQQVYLPVLHPVSPGHLLFLHYTPQTPLTRNVMNIAEPKLDVRNVLPLDKLDAVLVPLVAFDKQGQRLGMGGGFYDRTLQNWQHYHFTPVGYAYDCQLVDTLPAEQWDVPLPAVITPSRCWEW